MDTKSAIDSLRRVVEVCNGETETIVQELPTIEAVVGYVALLDAFDVESWEGVLESIQEGEDATPALAFARTHHLPKLWRESIADAMRLASDA